MKITKKMLFRSLVRKFNDGSLAYNYYQELARKLFPDDTFAQSFHFPLNWRPYIKARLEGKLPLGRKKQLLP